MIRNLNNDVFLWDKDKLVIGKFFGMNFWTFFCWEFGFNYFFDNNWEFLGIIRFFSSDVFDEFINPLR